MKPAHVPLGEDVSYLGDLLGSVLRDQGGLELFDTVESARHAAIHRRKHGAALQPLIAQLSELPLEQANALVRAFSVYFSLTNLAEQVHRIRRRRDYQLAGTPQPGSLEAVFATLAAAPPEQVRVALRQLCITPVFTAHPTEATRRTILKKEQRIARMMVDRIEKTQRTPLEDQRITERIRSEIGILWQTAGQSSTRPTVADEVEHVLFFLSEVVYRIVPPFVEALESASASYFAEDADRPTHAVLQFGSWVGGDMDGNPNAGAGTILASLARHRSLILKRYRSEVRGLFEQLSHSESRVSVSDDVRQRYQVYREQFPDAAAAIPERYADMPYRVLLWMIWHRLGLTNTEGYATADELYADLTCIAHSLKNHHGERAGLALVRRLLLRVRTFGFHLATLDLRQDAMVHRSAVGTLLGDPDFASREASARTDILSRTLRAVPAQPMTADPELTASLEVFRAVGEARRRYGAASVGPFIISMAQGADDVLAVLLLARTAGLTEITGGVPLDIAPLFETVDDLKHARTTVEHMLATPEYREHLRLRGDRQIIMLGYSDSAKISGVGASRWALVRAQEELVALAAEHGLQLELFHGRGGTVARGGSKPRAAILGGPPRSTAGRLRTTEQGEIINSKFGLRGIAVRTLELTAGAVLEATVRDAQPRDVPTPWREAMERIATESRAAWNALIHDDPRFIPYFRAATPVDVIERMTIGSRPASRRTGGGVENLRAIPWVFAWSQSRHTLPAWYGLGAGLAAAEQAHGLPLLQVMAREWLFFGNLLADASMALAKADLTIAAMYAELADAPSRPVYGIITDAFHETQHRILDVRGETDLLDHEPVLKETLRLRNPYVDPMSVIQVDLLRRWREAGRPEDDLQRGLFDTVRGIARGLRNTG